MKILRIVMVSYSMIFVFFRFRFLRNPSELKSIKNISLLRQQMEAQAAAQKMAAQHTAAYRGMTAPPKSVYGDSGNDRDVIKCESEASPFSQDDEPTDLTLDAEEKAALRMRERIERGQQRFGSVRNNEEVERDREQHEPRPSFDFRHLIPQVTIKTENC